jgi:ribosomal protein S27E
MILAELPATQLCRIEAVLNQVLSNLYSMTHAPKCERPGVTVEYGIYATTLRCEGCGATITKKTKP